MLPDSWNVVIPPPLIWFLASPCVLRASVTILLRGTFVLVTWDMVAVGVIKTVDKKTARAGKVTKSVQKAQKVKWILSPIPATHVLISGRRTVSELFVSVGHLSLIVKDWLMIKHIVKPSEGKENVLWAIYMCVRVCDYFKLLVFKISTF